MSKNILKPGWLLVLVLGLMLVFTYNPVLLAQDAQDPPETGDPGDTPEDTDEDPEADGTTSNLALAAQEQKAVNIDAALDEKASELEAEMEAIASKMAELEEDSEEYAALVDELAELTVEFDEAASAALETTPDTIAAMREDGLGWGQIAQELGVHPSTLGLGNAYGKTSRERTTARSKTGGVAAGHGLLADGSAAVGNGLGKNKDAAGQNKSQGNAYGKDKTKSGGVGQGKSQGKGGGQGGGQGGGKGGGKK